MGLKERRTGSRYLVHIPVFIYHSERRFLAHTFDVGFGGMKIHTDQIFPLRREFLFQLAPKTNSIWVKGRFVFDQTEPESVRFSCVRFLEVSKESIFYLQEFLSHLDHGPVKDQLQLESRIQEQEQMITKLLCRESERWKRGERILKELDEQFQAMSSKLADPQGKDLKATVQELSLCIEAMLKAMYDGLQSISLHMKGENGNHSVSFDETLSNLDRHYKEARSILENLSPSISEEMRSLMDVRWKCQDFLNLCLGPNGMMKGNLGTAS